MNSQSPFGNDGTSSNTGWNGGAVGPISVADSSEEVQLNFIRKTYVLFMAGILTCIVAGAICLNTPLVYVALNILGMPIVAFLLIVGGSIGAQALARTPGLNYVALFGFTGLLGFLFAPIIAMYNVSVVSQAAALSVLIFGALTAYAFVTRKNFDFLGGMLFVGIIAVIGGGLLNMLFFKSSGLSYWLAWAMLFVSSGFVLYQTSRLVHDHTPGEECSAALGLFISFFNIFTSLLRILSGGRD